MKTTNTSVFYILKIGGTNVKEIRRVIKDKDGRNIKYIIDKRKNVSYVNKEEFYTVPTGYKFVVVE